MAFQSGATAIKDYTGVPVNEGQSVKVYVRLRPPEDQAELSRRHFRLDEDDPTKITLRTSASGVHAFAYNRVFAPRSSQEEVFADSCQRLCDHVLDGYNSCIFAYGQTGSGKTHTMFGPPGEAHMRGLIPRSLEYLFSALKARRARKHVAVVVSFMETYMDNIRDLGIAYLEDRRRRDGVAPGDEPAAAAAGGGAADGTPAEGGGSAVLEPLQAMGRPASGGHRRRDRAGPGAGQTTSSWYQQAMKTRHTTFSRAGSGAHSSSNYTSQSLEIREDQQGNVFIENLSVIKVDSPEEAMDVVQRGFRLRATHETSLNAVSSRSHTVFTLHILQRDRTTGETVSGMLNLVDLAGSERLRRSQSEGMRKAEAMSINSSLTALGKVVIALQSTNTDGTHQHIPYRDSKLTRILQNSLGGNSFTALIATVHPRDVDADESLSTLQFANRCRSVLNKPKINYELRNEADKDRRIRQLETENSLLRRWLAFARVTARIRILRILRDLGVRGVLLRDGRVRTADGKILGVTMAQAAKSRVAKASARSMLSPSGLLSATALNAAVRSVAGKGGALASNPDDDAVDQEGLGALLMTDVDSADAQDGPGISQDAVEDVHRPPEQQLDPDDADTAARRSAFTTGILATRGTGAAGAGGGSGASGAGGSAPGDGGSGAGAGGQAGNGAGAMADAALIRLAAEDSGWADDGASAGTGGGGRGGGGFGAAAAIASAELAEARERIDGMQHSLQELRTENERLRERLRNETTALRSTMKEQRARLADAKASADVAHRARRDELEHLSTMYSQQVATILANNQALLSTQHSLVESVPRALRVSEDTLHRAAETEERVRREETARRRRDLASARAGMDATLQTERQRMQVAVDTMDAEHRRLENEFREWSETQQVRQSAITDELRTVWEYAASLQAVVRDMQNGAFPVEHAATGRKAFRIPPGTMPPDPFASHPTALAQLRDIMAEAGQPITLPKRGRARAQAGQAGASRFPAVGSGDRPYAGGAGTLRRLGGSLGTDAHGEPLRRTGERDVTVAPPSATDGKQDEHGADASADESDGGAAAAGGRGPQRRRGETLEQELCARAAQGDIDMDTNLEELDEDELRAHVTALRSYIGAGLRNRVEDEVLNDLAEQASIDYVRRLEQQRDAARARLEEEVARSKQLRVAYLALQRQVDRMSRDMLDVKAAVTAKVLPPALTGGDAGATGGPVLGGTAASRLSQTRGSTRGGSRQSLRGSQSTGAILKRLARVEARKAQRVAERTRTGGQAARGFANDQARAMVLAEMGASQRRPGT